MVAVRGHFAQLSTQRCRVIWGAYGVGLRVLGSLGLRALRVLIRMGSRSREVGGKGRSGGGGG